MTRSEFELAQQDCAVTAVRKAAARTMLEVTAARRQRVCGAPMQIQVMAVCAYDNAVAVAEEWGVIGSLAS